MPVSAVIMFALVSLILLGGLAICIRIALTRNE